MSAWSIGATTATRRRAGARVASGGDNASGDPTPVPSVDTLVKWIPGEVIAAYAAIVLALQPEGETSGDSTPLEITSGWWLIGGVMFAALLTWLAGWSKTQDLDQSATKELATRTVLAAVAFVIWSVVVPGSWWFSIESFAKNSTVVPLVAGLIGAAFALLAEGVVRRVDQ